MQELKKDGEGHCVTPALANVDGSPDDLEHHVKHTMFAAVVEGVHEPDVARQVVPDLGHLSTSPLLRL